jgi:predicted nucleotidyltransferase
MMRDSVLHRLRERQAELRDLGVRGLFLFGSTGRDQAGPDSDVDLFIDHEPGALGLFDVMDIAEAAAAILGQPVDLMTRGSIDPYLRPGIEADAIRVF